MLILAHMIFDIEICKGKNITPNRISIHLISNFFQIKATPPSLLIHLNKIFLKKKVIFSPYLMLKKIPQTISFDSRLKNNYHHLKTNSPDFYICNWPIAKLIGRKN